MDEITSKVLLSLIYHMLPSCNSPILCYLAVRRPAQRSCFADASKKLRKQTNSIRKIVRTEVLTLSFWISHRNVSVANTVKVWSSSFVIKALRHYMKMTHPQINFRHTLNAGHFGVTDLRTSFLKIKCCHHPVCATAGFETSLTV